MQPLALPAEEFVVLAAVVVPGDATRAKHLGELEEGRERRAELVRDRGDEVGLEPGQRELAGDGAADGPPGEQEEHEKQRRAGDDHQAPCAPACLLHGIGPVEDLDRPGQAGGGGKADSNAFRGGRGIVVERHTGAVLIQHRLQRTEPLVPDGLFRGNESGERSGGPPPDHQRRAGLELHPHATLGGPVFDVAPKVIDRFGQCQPGGGNGGGCAGRGSDLLEKVAEGREVHGPAAGQQLALERFSGLPVIVGSQGSGAGGQGRGHSAHLHTATSGELLVGPERLLEVAGLAVVAREADERSGTEARIRRGRQWLQQGHGPGGVVLAELRRVCLGQDGRFRFQRRRDIGTVEQAAFRPEAEFGAADEEVERFARRRVCGRKPEQ